MVLTQVDVSKPVAVDFSHATTNLVTFLSQATGIMVFMASGLASFSKGGRSVGKSRRGLHKGLGC